MKINSSSQFEHGGYTGNSTKRRRVDDYFTANRPLPGNTSTKSKKRAFEDVETCHDDKLNTTTKRARLPCLSTLISNIALDTAMDDAMEGVEVQGNCVGVLLDNFREESDNTQTSLRIAIHNTKTQIAMVLQTPLEPSHQLQMTCQILLDFTKARQNLCRGRLSSEEEAAFRTLGPIMEDLAYSMTMTEKWDFDVELISKVEMGFAKGFGLYGIANGLNGYFGAMHSRYV